MTDAEAQLEDQDLLRKYVQEHSGRAFAELVRRHVDAVYSAALRRVNWDRAMAEDVAQCVFTDFARKAVTFPAGTVPGGWLHRHTGFVASHHIDRERRRRLREQQAVAMNALTEVPDGDPEWRQTAPLLDDALDALPAPDRDAVVLRFFEKKDYRAVGRELGVSDDTAQKRVGRALEKLRALLARRGVTSTGAALSALMLAHTITPAPAALATTLPGRALAGAAGAGTTLAAAGAGLSTAARWKLAGLAAACIAAGAAPFVIHRMVSAPPETRVVQQAVPAPAPPPQTVVAAPASAGGPPVAAGPASTADLVAAAAVELRGGAQNVGATARALALLTQIPVTKEKPDEALARIAAVADAPARSLLYRYFLSHWAEINPQGAVYFALHELPGEQQISTSEAVLNAWAARDPKGAIEWNEKVSAQTLSSLREPLISTLFKTLASRDIDQALAWMSRLRNDNEKALALRGVLDTAVTQTQRNRLTAAIDRLKDDDLRLQGRRAVVESWARESPEEAAGWIDGIEPAWQRPRLMDSLGLVWLQSDPEAASAWWMAREPGPDTLVKIINVWSRRDANGAGRWLRKQPPGPLSDPARMTFARQVADMDPESALQWASTVSDEPMRESAIDHIYKTWTARKPEDAAAFLKSSGWPAERLTRLTSQAASPP